MRYTLTASERLSGRDHRWTFELDTSDGTAVMISAEQDGESHSAVELPPPDDVVDDLYRMGFHYIE